MPTQEIFTHQSSETFTGAQTVEALHNAILNHEGVVLDAFDRDGNYTDVAAGGDYPSAKVTVTVVVDFSGA